MFPTRRGTSMPTTLPRGSLPGSAHSSRLESSDAQCARTRARPRACVHWRAQGLTLDLCCLWQVCALDGLDAHCQCHTRARSRLKCVSGGSGTICRNPRCTRWILSWSVAPALATHSDFASPTPRYHALQLLTRGRGRELHALDAAAAAVLTPVRASSQRTSMDLSAHALSISSSLSRNLDSAAVQPSIDNTPGTRVLSTNIDTTLSKPISGPIHYCTILANIC